MVNSDSSVDSILNDTSTLQPRNRNRLRCRSMKDFILKALHVVHFFIVMVYLWAALVEFINNPPFFDAYGDAGSDIQLPEGIFENDPRNSQNGLMRLMDIPILAIILAYVAVSTWLRYEGLSWLLTVSLSMAFLAFWVVNFWAQSYFDWRYYSSRMSGLELQVSTLALAATNILCVLFYKRRKLPFKFKSSLPIKNLGPVHLIYNFCCIFIIMFASMLLWFTKMYISWACFKNHDDLTSLCQVTSQVQCYSCHQCTTEGMRMCFKNVTNRMRFSCSSRIPEESKYGSFCIFNYNISGVGFLTIFAYIGGLCVFLSTFIRIFGHYTFRGIFFLYEKILVLLNKSSKTLKKHRERQNARAALRDARRSSTDASLNSPRELLCPGTERDVEDGRVRSQSQLSDFSYISDGDDNGNFLDASCG